LWDYCDVVGIAVFEDFGDLLSVFGSECKFGTSVLHLIPRAVVGVEVAWVSDYVGWFQNGLEVLEI
jgi:hypothetical protein